MRLLFIFIDGVGLGRDHPCNPFVITETPGLISILDGKRLTAKAVGSVGSRATLLGLDATLGVQGLPQSATGQASIFTGVNAAGFLGTHLNGYPDTKLRRLLAAKGMFRQLRKQHYKVIFANAYRPQFFQLLRRGLPGKRYSCSTLITYYGGLPFYGLNDIKQGRALYMDITNDILLQMGFVVPSISPEEGARRLLNISRNYDFCLFEYFLSDLAGHMADQSEASRVIAILDRFIGTLADQNDPSETLIIVSSDHGNLEDLTRRAHTYNKVPALLIGDAELRSHIEPDLNDLTDLLPAIFKTLAWNKN